MVNKYMFVLDDDCHWYLIPVSMSSAFHSMLEKGEDDCYCTFNCTFEEYRIDSPCGHTFENPEYM